MRPDGSTDGDHGEARKRIEGKLRGVDEKRHKKTGDPDEPEFPDTLAYLWTWFREILNGIAPNGMSAAAIGWSDLAAWSALTGEVLEPWEARLLVDLSALRVDILSEKKP